MTTPAGGGRRGMRRPPRIRWTQIVAVAVVLAIFVTGLVVAGWVGALIIAALSAAAGLVLMAHWRVLDQRVRLVRMVIVLIGFAVALSLLTR